MKFQVMTVAPEIAKQWLEKKGKNRKVSRRHVENIAREINAGKWVLNADTIKFTSDGELVDGQHRLEGIILAGVPVQVAVAFGVDDERAFETIDVTLRKRSAHQIAGDIDGVENASTKVAVARRLLIWEQTPNKTMFNLAPLNYQATFEVLDYLREHENEITNMYNRVTASTVYKKCGAGAALIASLIVCNRSNPVKAESFIQGLTTGINLYEGSSVHLLREKLLFPPVRYRNIQWNVEVMALVIKAFNYHGEDKSLRILRWRQEGDSPERFPMPKGA